MDIIRMLDKNYTSYMVGFLDKFTIIIIMACIKLVEFTVYYVKMLAISILL